MTFKEQLESRKLEAREIYEKEAIKEKITKPSLIDEVLSFDFSKLDTLSPDKLHNYAGALAQQIIWLNSFVNGVNIGVVTTEEFLNQILGQETLKVEGKSEKEKVNRVMANIPELLEIKNDLINQQSKLAFYSNKIDTYNGLLNIIKKVLDSHRSPYQHFAN